MHGPSALPFLPGSVHVRLSCAVPSSPMVAPKSAVYSSPSLRVYAIPAGTARPGSPVTGDNINDLRVKYRLSEPYLYQVIAAERERRRVKQLSLPGVEDCVPARATYE
ncbi:hypothetical protein KL86DPRO_20352 [uncultured delta proteobacterium]|uniref:Uncharacterized protein n=1 Tax=uncultured delta proteobacterium TaxID=34034 RepID=A0A212JEV5_9DELT|nr:hypothetical protein KL86DPRO_11303 [uncultured delta proteobacterium]SBW04653.1 hypothetical protein KL86DPRO_20352 [uncultured delta proteobacterium]